MNCKEKLNDIVCESSSDYDVLNDIYNYIDNLEQQVKKQKEVIDYYKEDILNLLDIINKNCNELKCTSDEWLVIQKYQEKEVSE